MPFKTTLEAALAHLKAKGIIRRDNDIMEPLGIKSKGTVSSYSSGTHKMSSGFKDKFENYYGIKLADFENLVGNEEEKKPAPANGEDYRDKYISLLEQQIQDRDRQLSELKIRMDSRTLQITEQIEKLSTSLAAHDQTARIALAYAKTLYLRLQEHFARVEPKPTPVNQKVLERVAAGMDTLLGQQLEESFQPGEGSGN